MKINWRRNTFSKITGLLGFASAVLYVLFFLGGRFLGDPLGTMALFVRACSLIFIVDAFFNIALSLARIKKLDKLDLSFFIFNILVVSLLVILSE